MRKGSEAERMKNAWLDEIWEIAQKHHITGVKNCHSITLEYPRWTALKRKKAGSDEVAGGQAL